MPGPCTCPLAKQLKDGGRCPSKDCVASAGRMLAYRASVGRWDLHETKIREATGTSCSVGTGGISYGPLCAALEELTNHEITADVYINRTRQQVRSAIAAGSFVIMSGLYRELHGTGYECDDDFLGGHAFGLNAFRVREGARDQVKFGDPLADGRYDYREGWIWLNQDLVWRTGEARTGGDPGSASITIVMSNDTEDVDGIARIDARYRSKPDVHSSALGRCREGDKVHTIYTKNGGPWQRDSDGGISTLWRKTPNGWLKGEAVVAA